MATDDVEVELEEMGLDISAVDPVARKRTLVRFGAKFIIGGGRKSVSNFEW